MVVLRQSTPSIDAQAMQIMLDGLNSATKGSQNAHVDREGMTEKDLVNLRDQDAERTLQAQQVLGAEDRALRSPEVACTPDGPRGELPQ